jgi:hypothetical protein
LLSLCGSSVSALGLVPHDDVLSLLNHGTTSLSVHLMGRTSLRSRSL